MSSDKEPFAKIKIPKVSIGYIEPYGELFLRGLSYGNFIELSKLDLARVLPADELATQIILALVYNRNDQPLSQEEIGAFASDSRRRVVRAIIEQNPHWFAEDRNEEGKGSDLAKLNAPMEQREGEGDEEYLARGFRAELAAINARTSSMMSGLSDRLKGLLGPGIAANTGASARLSNLLHTIRPEPITLKIPEIPRNPIHETNEILREVASQIGQMRDLAAATADIQRTLNDTATAAVADFSKGAEKSRKATRNGLWIAGATLLVSILAVGVSIYTLKSQNAGVEAREAELRAQTERLMAKEAELVGTIEHLSQEVGRLREEAEARATEDAKANRERGKRVMPPGNSAGSD